MTSRDATPRAREDAGCATAEGGVVVLDGPNGVAVTMTPEAAIRTADSLYAAATLAKQSAKPAGDFSDSVAGPDDS